MNDPFTKGNESAAQMSGNAQESVRVLDIEKRAQPMHKRIGKEGERTDGEESRRQTVLLHPHSPLCSIWRFVVPVLSVQLFIVIVLLIKVFA